MRVNGTRIHSCITGAMFSPEHYLFMQILEYDEKHRYDKQQCESTE